MSSDGARVKRPEAEAGTRDLRDPKAMRAMAHPTRLEIMEILREAGPLTATELGERLGQSPANASFHLRTLAKYGFIEEADTQAKGRSRPWQEPTGGLLVREEELTGEARRAAEAMTAGFRSMLFRRIERWAAERAGYPKPWQSVGFQSEFRTDMTAEELREVSRKFGEALEPFKRPKSEVPDGAARVTIAAWGFPTELPEEPPEEPAEEGEGT